MHYIPHHYSSHFAIYLANYPTTTTINIFFFVLLTYCPRPGFCFVINSRVLSANRANLGYFCSLFFQCYSPNYLILAAQAPHPPQKSRMTSKQSRPKIGGSWWTSTFHCTTHLLSTKCEVLATFMRFFKIIDFLLDDMKLPCFFCFVFVPVLYPS